MTEELALEERVGNRTTVQRHEGVVGEVAVEVDRTCHELLAGAALASDQDRAEAVAQLVDGLGQPPHRGGRADHARHAVTAVQFVLEDLDLLDEPGNFSPLRLLEQPLTLRDVHEME